MQRDLLMGLVVGVSALSGRGRWWVRIDTVSDDGRSVRVSGGVAFGKERWVAVDAVDGRTNRAKALLAAWIEARRPAATTALEFSENRANYRRIKTHEL
jgi:hypothetical protein